MRLLFAPLKILSKEKNSNDISILEYRNKNSIVQVNAQAVGNGHAHGIASSEERSFIRFPGNENTQSQITPL